MDSSILSKIEAALNKIIDPYINFPENVFKTLLRHLKDEEEDLGATAYPHIREEFIIPWLKKTIEAWKSEIQSVQFPKILFLTKLVSSMSTNEQLFIKLNFTDILANFVQLIRTVPDVNDDLIKLNYIRLLNSLLSHKSGVQFVIVRNFWFDVYSCVSYKGEVGNESSKFVVNLMEKTKNDNELFCYNVMEMIVQPINDLTIVYSDCQLITDDVSLKLSLVTLKNVLEALYEKNCDEINFKVIQGFRERFQIETKIDQLILAVQNQEMRLELYKITLILAFFEGAYTLLNKVDLPHDYALKMIDVCVKIIENYPVKTFLDFVYSKIGYFQQISSKTSRRDIINYAYQCQIILIILRPLHYFTFNVLNLDRFNDSEDACRKHFTLNMLSTLVPTTHEFISRLSNSTKTFTVQDATTALRYLIANKNVFVNKFASNLSQMLIYMFLDFLNFLKESPERLISMLSEDFMVTFLDALTTILKSFNLVWKDSPEIIYVTEITSEFLSHNVWPPTIVVKTLELLEIAISKCLSPKMTLLIDSPDFDETVIKNVISSKAIDDNPQIRNAALQVVRAVSCKAKNFPSYEKLILELNLQETVFNIAITDGIAANRMAAFQSLQVMVNVKSIKIKLINLPNLIDETIQIIYFHHDPFVKTEVVKFLTALFRKWSPDECNLEKLCDALNYAATEDYDLNVKINALNFWYETIQKKLEERGVIDGNFPEQTFSRRRRKIVTYCEKEIRKTLGEVLDELTDIGCVSVFLKSLKSEVKELRSTAIDLIQNLATLLTKHPFTLPVVIPQELPSMDAFPCLDSFCEEILNWEDRLFACESSESGYSDTLSPADRSLEKNEFLKFVCNYDFHRDMEMRRLNILEPDESIHSVLNEILKS